MNIHMLWLVFLTGLVAALPVDVKRDVVTSTQKVGWAALFGLAATLTPTTTTVAAPAAATAATVAAVSTPAVTTPVAAATATSEGFLDKILALFDDSATTTTAAPAAPATTTPATTATTSTSSLWLLKLLSLFGLSSDTTTSTSAAATASTPTLSTSTTSTASAGLLEQLLGGSASTQSPSFTGLVEVPGGQASLTATASGSVESLLSEAILQVALYAEMGKGITYSPYTKSGACKTALEVAADIAMLSHYSIIRLYAVDCLGIENVVAAMGSTQKLFLGIWAIDAIDTDLPSMATQVLTGSRGWSAVDTVAIGNEVVNSGTNTVAQVLAAVSSARAWFLDNASAYDGSIVAVDTLLVTIQNQEMCDILDYIAVNCHPYFLGVEALTSGTWLAEQVASLKSFCNNGKDILVTESGWPTYGDTVGLAVPSVANQLLAIKGLGETMGDLVIMFTTYNDYWKAPGSYNVEQHWGIYGDPAA